MAYTIRMLQLVLFLIGLSHQTHAEDLCCRYPKDCHDVAALGNTEDGPYEVRPTGTSVTFFIYCEFDQDGTAWALLQRRVDGFTSFNRAWQEYRHGFGVPGPQSNYWLGLDNMHELTTQRQYTVRVDVKDWDGEARYADYGLFYINDASTSYSLMLKYYLGGTLGDSFSFHCREKFSTFDRDTNRLGSQTNCAETYGGGWWYGVESCWTANLNGMYQQQGNGFGYVGLTWNQWKTRYSFKESSMRIKPTFSAS